MITWFKIADIIHALPWQANNMLVTEVDGKKITVVKNGDELFACAHKCPHASGVLADGFLDATGKIVCPLHRYKFDLSNGRNTTGEGYYLKIYPVEIREGSVYIGIKRDDWLGWLR